MYSATYLRYLEGLHRGADNLYEIAEKARRLGHDPKPFVEIPQASDLADRTQKLLSYLEPRKTAEQIRELTESFDGNRERVAIEIAKIVSAETFLYGKIEDCPTCEGRGEVGNNEKWMKECYDCHGSGTTVGFEEAISKTPYQETLTVFQERIKQGKLWTPDTPSQKLSEAAVYHGICAGLAVLTEGILVAPLEGVVSARFFKNGGKKHTLAVSYAGPIRSAGGTGQALSVLIADIVRRDFGLEKPIMSYDEVERYKEEVGMYRGLQYRPSNPQIEEMVNACPIYIDGEGVGNEVTGQRDLPRVKTNKVREGMLLVLCEGLTLKAPKILKYVDALNLDGWDFLRPFAKGSGGKKEGNKMPEIKPSTKFISDVLAGRPIFSQPMQEGGFRLRYGRSRLAGLATTSINPAVMKALSGFVIIGTQLKYERPGKGTVATPCDEIDGPYIQFKDGSGKMVNDYDELPFQYPTDPDYVIEKVWDLGELLVPVGEFLENNHVLIESPYVPEWYEQEVKDKGLKLPQNLTEVISFSKKHKIPIHPDYVAFYDNLSLDEFIQAVNDTNPATGQIKNKEWAYRMCIDVNSKGMLQGKKAQFWRKMCMGIDLSKTKGIESPLQFINQFFFVRPRITYRIGARMGKPEGSKMREMKPPVHTVFTVGHKVGSKRLVADAAKRTDAKQIGIFYCESCSEMTTKGVCPRCNKEALFDSVQWVGKDDELWEEVSIKNQWESAIEKVKVAEAKLPEVGFGVKSSKKILGANPQVKGVKGMTSKTKTNEHLVKGLLRFKNNISTFRDGTIRFDMVDITMTHFKPKEIGLTVEKARELGYEVKDEMESVPLFAQDVVLPTNCAEMMLNTANYIDDLLSTLYEVEPFYRCEIKEDLVGHLLMGIAPHTSGAILGRIIGFADIKGHYGHPFFHAAKRRNCDGDIDAVLLMLDGLLNFSKSFLPGNRGGLMDAPLILTTTINPTEIDKEALNVDTLAQYPVSFYEGTMKRPVAKEAHKLGIETVETRLEQGKDPFIFEFTHDTLSCDQAPKNNPYNTLESMRQKTMMQFELGEVLHAVDNKDQAGRLINRHLIRDMRGNLRAYGQQKVRCTKCGASYRRPPIAGKCITVVKKDAENPLTGEIENLTCDHKLILTVHQGSVKKYDNLMNEIIQRYGVDNYTDNLYHLVSSWVADTFSSGEELSQSSLNL
jgi:DNA polymerase II large subunit